MKNKPDSKETRLILEEIVRRESGFSFDFTQHSFPAQLNFIQDPAKLKAAFCTRRAAKSYSAGLYLIKEALSTPGVSCLYVGLTRESAKRILWKDVLKALNRKFKLGITFNESALTATLTNGSIIYLVGADSNEEEKQKLLGQKYKIVIIDEAQSYTIDLRELVYSILKPAVADYRGTICLIGTPGNLTKGLFYDITNGKEPGWALHKWNTFDNPFMAKQWQEEIDDLVKAHPLIVETPWFKQNYLGQWVVDLDKLVYKFNQSKNLYANLPALLKGTYRYVLGVDLGFDDDSAFTVVCYSDNDPNLYILECFKKSKMDITDVANKIKEYQNLYDFDKIIVDGANKQAVQEIRNRHSIPLRAADKQGKADFIEIMNSELIQGNIKVHEKAASILIDEWLGLIWLTKGDQIVFPKTEHPNCSNHVSDSTLYAWRYCYQYLWEKIVEKPKPGSPEYFQHEIDHMEAQAEAEYSRMQQEMAEDSSVFGYSDD